MRPGPGRLAGTALALLLLVPGGAAAEDIDPYALSEIPKEFQGRWARDSQGCATGRGRVEISGRRLRVGGDPFEASYIASHDTPSPDLHRVGVVSKYIGSAKPSWTRVDGFTLSADRKKLTDDHAGRKIVLVRCGTR